MQKLSHIQKSRRSDQSSASQAGVKTFTEGEGEGESEVFARTDFTDAQWGVAVKA
jgi:hypothetical protein